MFRREAFVEAVVQRLFKEAFARSGEAQIAFVILQLFLAVRLTGSRPRECGCAALDGHSANFTEKVGHIGERHFVGKTLQGEDTLAVGNDFVAGVQVVQAVLAGEGFVGWEHSNWVVVFICPVGRVVWVYVRGVHVRAFRCWFNGAVGVLNGTGRVVGAGSGLKGRLRVLVRKLGRLWAFSWLGQVA